jgi:hypothetical protein
VNRADHQTSWCEDDTCGDDERRERLRENADPEAKPDR